VFSVMVMALRKGLTPEEITAILNDISEDVSEKGSDLDSESDDEFVLLPEKNSSSESDEISEQGKF